MGDRIEETGERREELQEEKAATMDHGLVTKTFHIDFQPTGRRGECRESDSILDCGRYLGVGISSVCGGRGKCRTCKVKVMKGTATEPTQAEQKVFSPREFGEGWRLACQALPTGDCRIEVPVESMTSPQRTQVEGLEVSVAPDPLVRTYRVKLSAPTLSDAAADADRLIASLNRQHGAECSRIDGEALRTLSPALRVWNWECLAALRAGEVISVSAPDDRPLGLAVDLGSTKIAGYLVSLEEGKVLASRGIMNPQISYGEDIVSRMDAAIRTPADGEKLRHLVVDAINELAVDLCKEMGTFPEKILESVVVGNTAMHHLFLGLPVAQLALAPYIPAAGMALDYKARGLGLRFGSGGYVHVFPNIAGYVGGDHVAVLLSLEAAAIQGITLALDIGTNTEVSLLDNDRVSSVSCASGPAFEGYQIKHGMRAARGAIERVRISAGEIEYETIDGAPPVGICGSGVLDALAGMVSEGIVDKGGRILEGHPRVRDRNGYREFVLIEEEAMAGRQAIVLTQADIRHLQLAKAAIRTGIEVLLDANGKSEKEVDNVIIAGAFGSYIDVSSAITIGMLPDLPITRFRQVGNGAGAGARLALVSSSMRAKASKLVARVRYVELATAPRFNDIFVQACYLGDLEAGK